MQTIQVAKATAANPTLAEGDYYPLSMDDSGNLRCFVSGGTIIIAPTTSDTCSQNGVSSVGTSSSQAIAANANRKRLILQNVGTTVIYVLLGSGTASATNFTYILPMGGTTKDGSSPIQYDTMWIGAVQWASSGAGGLAVANENT